MRPDGIEPSIKDSMESISLEVESSEATGELEAGSERGERAALRASRFWVRGRHRDRRGRLGSAAAGRSLGVWGWSRGGHAGGRVWPGRRCASRQGAWTGTIGCGCLLSLVRRGCYPARAGGPWLCSTLVRSGFHAVVVPSGSGPGSSPSGGSRSGGGTGTAGRSHPYFARLHSDMGKFGALTYGRQSLGKEASISVTFG